MVRIIVHHCDIEHALRALRKKSQREGKPRSMKKVAHETRGEKRARKKAESCKRRRKVEFKRLRSEF